MSISNGMPSATLSSKITHDEHAHRFVTQVDGHRAVLVYSLDGSAMSIDHTEVPPAIGGRGIAADLMRRALEEARERRWSVIPRCSYAAAYMNKHPDETSAEL